MNWNALRHFQDSLQDLGIAGNDLAVYVKSEPVYRYCTGWQNREKQIPISERTLYRMFSMSKLITCAAALQLLEEGAFLMNDPLSDYLPEFSRMLVKQEGAFPRPAENPLLIHHLFTMTSGIDYDLDAPEIVRALEKYGDQISTRQMARAIAEKPLQFEPGSHWLYGLSHDVLGALIEAVSGKRFSDYLRERIFEPLDMKDTWFREPKDRSGDVCLRYGLDNQGKWILSDQQNHLQPGSQFESGGAGLTMTVDDYARFACALTAGGIGKNGGRILAGRTVGLMRTNTLGPVQLNDFWQTSARQGYGYGFGVRTMMDPAVSGSPTPAGEFGWGGAWGSYTLLDPVTHVTIVYAEQAEDTKGPFIQRRLRNMVYAALEWEGCL